MKTKPTNFITFKFYKLSTFVLLTFFLLNGTQSSSQALIWAKQIGGSLISVGYSNIVDNSGNIYTVGTFQGTVDFDPGVGNYSLTSAGNNDAFISKLDASGNFLWAKQMGGTGTEYSSSVALDVLGNVYVLGHFQLSSTFGTTNLISAGNFDVFISKLSSSGNFIWTKQIGGTGIDYGKSIDIDSAGNLYLVGYFTGIVDFDPNSGINNLTAMGLTDGFICKLNSLGNFIWAKQMGGSGSNTSCNSIFADNLGNLFCTGNFSDTADLDPGIGINNFISKGGTDIFISKLDTSGNFLFAKQIGGPGSESPSSIFIDFSGNLYTTGFSNDTVDFDPGPGVYNIDSLGLYDIFISKLNALGNFVWAKRIGGAKSELGSSVKVDNSGNVYIVGEYFSDSVDFNPGIGMCNFIGSYGGYILKLDSLGNFAWANQIGGGSNKASCNSIILDASSNSFYTTGYFSGNVDFDPGSGVYSFNSGIKDIYIAKYSLHLMILSQTHDTVVCKGTNFEFNVNAGGLSNYTYQWKKNGVDIINAHNSNLLIPTVTPSDEGVYTCVINNGIETVTSIGAQLKVIDLNVNAGTDFTFCNDTATHIIAVATTNHTEFGSLNYSWTPTTNLGSPT